MSHTGENDEVLDYQSHLNEAIGFIAMYRGKLISFLEHGDYGYARYDEEMYEFDAQLHSILNVLLAKVTE